MWDTGSRVAAVTPTHLQCAYIRVPPEWLYLNGVGTPTVPAGSWRSGLGARARSLALLVKTLKT